MYKLTYTIQNSEKKIILPLQIYAVKDTNLFQASIILRNYFNKQTGWRYIATVNDISRITSTLYIPHILSSHLNKVNSFNEATMLNDLCKRSCFRLAYHFTSHNLYHKGWKKMKGIAELARMDKYMPKDVRWPSVFPHQLYHFHHWYKIFF